MYNSFTRYVQHFFPRKAKKFSRGLVPLIVTALFSRTKKRAVCFCNQLQK